MVKLASALFNTKIRRPSLLKLLLLKCKQATLGAAVSLLRQSILLQLAQLPEQHLADSPPL